VVHRYERFGDRAEFELGWLAFGMLLGFGYLLQPSVTVQALMPPWFVYVWAAAFLAGGVVGLWSMPRTFSLVWSRYYWGLVGERTGHGLQVAAVSTLAVAVVYIWTRTPHAPFPVLSLALVGVWMTIALRRIVRVTQIIKAMAGDKGEGTNG
jgi:hypothetical protein